MNTIAAIILIAGAIAPAKPDAFQGVPPPPAPVIFSVPSGALPWPVPEFGASAPTIGTLPEPVHSVDFADLQDDVEANLDVMSGPFTDLTDDLTAANTGFDASVSLDSIMVTDPVTGSPISMQSMVDSSVDQIAAPFEYSRSFAVFGGTVTAEYPHMLHMFVFLWALMFNVILHFLVLVVRSLWSFASFLTNLIFKTVEIIADLIPG